MVVDGLVWHTSRVFIVTNIVAKAFCEETGTKPFPIDVVLRKFKKDFIRAWSKTFREEDNDRAYIQIMDDKPIFSFFPPTICAYFRLGQLIRVEESFPRVMVSAKPDDLFTVIDRFKQEHVLQYAGVVDPVGQVHVFGFPGQLSSDGPARVFCFDVDSEDLLEWIEPEEKLKIMKVYEDCIKKQAGPFRCHVL